MIEEYTLEIASDPSDTLHREGVLASWHPETQEIALNAWYDQGCTVGEVRLPLKQFFDQLGITIEDCNKVFEERR